MNRKQLVILLVLLVVVGGAGLLLRQKQSRSYQDANPAMGTKLLGDLPVNNVAHISIKQGGSELNLVKKGDLWRVRERADYPANYTEISDLLLKLRELKIVQTEKVGASQLPRLALVPGEGTNSALVLDLKDQNQKPVKTMLLGKKHMKKGDRRASPYGDMGDQGWPDGRYVKVATDSDTVAVISDPLANVEPKPEQWLNKDFFKIEKPRSIAVNFPNATNSWKLERETEAGEWKLVDVKPGEQLDNGKASGVANPLSSASFADVASSSKPEELDKATVATIETFDQITYTLKVGQKTNDNYPLAMTVAAQLPKERPPGKDEKPEDKDKLDKEFKEKNTKLEEKLAQEKPLEKWVYLVSSWTVDPLLKERAQLMVEKKEEPKDGTKDAAGEIPGLQPLPPPVGEAAPPPPAPAPDPKPNP